MSKPVISNTFSLTAIKQGDDGTPGGNTATLFLFKRSATPISAIDWNYALTYNFASQSLSSTPSGWTLNKVPAGTDPVYVTAATAYSTEATDSIAANEWSSPVLYTENNNTAPVFLFQRKSTAPDKPTATLTYTFATGVLSGSLAGWSQTIPDDNGLPCWVIQATAIGSGTTDTIAASEWSEQRKLVEDGADAIHIDIDNQSDTIACHDDGTVRFAREITTVARITKGATQLKKTEITSPTVAQCKLAGKNATSVTTADDGTITIKWNFATTDKLTSSNYEVSIPVVYNSKTYSARFSLGVTNDLSIYQLAPSLNAINFTRAGDNTLTPSSITVSCGYVKINADGCSAVSAYTKAATQGIDSKYSIYYRYQKADGTYTSWTLPTSNTSIGVSRDTTYAAVEYALAPSSGTVSDSNIIDRETIPINKDAASSFYGDITNDNDLFGTDSAGVVQGTQKRSTKVHLFVGSTKQKLTANPTVSLKYATSGNAVAESVAKATTLSGNNTTEGSVEISIYNSQTVTDVIYVDITAQCDAGSKELRFTLKPVKSGAPGVSPELWQLAPTHTELSYGRNSDDTLTPSSIAMNVNAIKVVGAVETKYTSDQTGLRIYWGYDNGSAEGNKVIGSSWNFANSEVANHTYVWFELRSSVDSYTDWIDRETVPIRKDGLRGATGTGEAGNGIASDDFYYALTSTVEPPSTTNLTQSYGWYKQGDSGCPTQPTKAKPYLWQCEYIQYTKDTSLNKKIVKLVQVYNLETQPNLLEQTAFDSEDVMDAWSSHIGEVRPQARGAMNAWGCFPTSSSYCDFLSQKVFIPGTLAKIQANKYYTLSFYSRTRKYVNVDGHTYGFYFEDIYLKAGSYQLQFNGRCTTTAYNDGVQLNGYLWYSDYNNQTADWSIATQASVTSKSDATATSSTLTITKAGYYRIGFYAFKTQGSAGGVDDVVHVNWWRIKCTTNNSRFDTYLYPSALYSGSTYFVDGVVKSGLGADGAVLWYPDNDDALADSGGWTRHSVTFKTKSSITLEEQKVLFRLFNTYMEICMPKLEEGVMATPWVENEYDSSTECTHNPCGSWVMGRTYYYCNGLRDVVRAMESLNGGLTWWRMKKRTTNAGYVSNIIPFLDTEHWEKANRLKFSIVDAMFAEEIFTDKLTVSKLRTTGSNSFIDMHDGLIEFYGLLGFANIVLGVNDDGCAVLKFYDKDGNFKYDLGPDSIMSELDSVASSWGSTGALGQFDMTQNATYAVIRSIPNVDTSYYYTFYEGYTTLNSVKKYNISGTSTPSSTYNKKVFNSKSMSGTSSSAYPVGTKIPAGYYLGKEFMMATHQEIESTAGIYTRRVYSVSSAGQIPTLLGTLYYYKDDTVNNTYLTDSEGNALSVSSSNSLLTYVQDSGISKE